MKQIRLREDLYVRIKRLAHFNGATIEGQAWQLLRQALPLAERRAAAAERRERTAQALLVEEEIKEK